MTLGRMAQIAGIIGTLVAVIALVMQFWNPGPTQIYQNESAIHIGDEEFSTSATDWVPLQGGEDCLRIPLPDKLKAKTLLLTYESFGLEVGFVQVNSGQKVSLPPQKHRGARPNYWSDQEKVKVPIGALYTNGGNTLAICAGKAPREEHPGDLDDFQLRKVSVVAK